MDKLRRLSPISENSETKLEVPSQGYVKFKVVYVTDTNNCFINLISNDVQQEDGSIKTTYFNLFNKFDAELQLYYSKQENYKDY